MSEQERRLPNFKIIQLAAVTVENNQKITLEADYGLYSVICFADYYELTKTEKKNTNNSYCVYTRRVILNFWYVYQACGTQHNAGVGGLEKY